MESFTKPASLNGETLIAELEAAGVTVIANSMGIKCPSIDGNGELWLDIIKADKAKALAVVANHQG